MGLCSIFFSIESDIKIIIGNNKNSFEHIMGRHDIINNNDIGGLLIYLYNNYEMVYGLRYYKIIRKSPKSNKTK